MPTTLSTLPPVPVALGSNTRILHSPNGVALQRMAPFALINKQASVVTLAADVTNTSNVTFSAVVSASVVAGQSYWVKYAIRYTTTSPALLAVRQVFTSGAVGTKQLLYTAVLSDTDSATCYNAYDGIPGAITPLVIPASTTAGSSLLIIEGMVTCSTSGNISVQFRSNTNGVGVTVLARSSLCIITT